MIFLWTMIITALSAGIACVIMYFYDQYLDGVNDLG